MNVLTTTWRQLVRRRLWPVALLLVATLAAVPVLLGRDPEPVAAPSQAAAPGTSANVSDSLAAPVVDKATPEQRSRRRRVLGARKDPFAPDSVKHPKKQKKAVKKKADATPKQATAPTQPSSPSISVPTVPVVTTPAKPKKTYAKGSLIVRFGDAASGALERINLKKLAALPDDTQSAETEPLIVYLGLTSNGKKAKFLVDASLEPTGDGTCKPHPASCETIELAKGETEFFDLVDPVTGDITSQFQLDLVDIK
jgi:hypothetical protein